MELTAAAEKRLRELSAKTDAGNLRLEGLIGTCRGSAPVLKPASGPKPGDAVFEAGGIKIFIAPDCIARMSQATIDYDSSLFGKGLTVQWPHHAGCSCRE